MVEIETDYCVDNVTKISKVDPEIAQQNGVTESMN